MPKLLIAEKILFTLFFDNTTKLQILKKNLSSFDHSLLGLYLYSSNTSFAFDGAFTSSGDYYYSPGSAGAGTGMDFYKIPNPDGATGYSDRNDVNMPADPSVLVFAMGNGGDVTAADIDLGSGVSTYLFTLNTSNTNTTFNI